MASNYEYLCNPSSVAVFGASAKEGNWGYELVKSLINGGYKGEIYPINPKGGALLGRNIFKSIKEIDSNIEMAIIGIKADYVINTILECREKGVKIAVIISGGFAEMGPEGRKLQDDVLKAAGEMRLVGPNTLGIADLSNSFNASVLSPEKGSIAMLCQSGNMTDEIAHLVAKRGIGFTKFFDFGNQIDLGTSEFLECVLNDDETKVVILHMEGLKENEGAKFINIARQLTIKKPLIAIKAGITETGLKAASSHTGALAGNDAIYDAALKQAGVIRVKNPTELVELAEAFVKMPRITGRKIAILTDGGGHTTLACDLLGDFGLVLAELSPKTINELKGILLPHAPILNPVDFAGTLEADLAALPKAAEVLLNEENIDGLMIIGTHLGEYSRWSKEITDESVALELADIIKRSGKPVVYQNYIPDDDIAAVRLLQRGGIPVYIQIESAVRAMGALLSFGEKQCYDTFELNGASSKSEETIKSKAIINKTLQSGRKNLLETEAREILEAYGLPVLKSVLAKSRKEAAEAANKIGFPLAAKIVSPQIIHKTDAGGVMLNLKGENEVSNAFEILIANAKAYNPDAVIEGVLLSPMAKPGREVIIGMVKDKQFGPVLMLGLGGVFVEVLKDVSFRVAPITAADAKNMIDSLKGKALLYGIRGEAQRVLGAITDVLLKISKLVSENEEIDEIDINPLFVYEKGIVAVDARIILS